MKNSVLQIQMFGTYSIKYEDKPISFERNTTTKTNQLMQILLQAGDKGIPRTKLLSSLFGDEDMANPANSLPVTGMATIPIRNANSHQVQNVHTSPFNRNADSPARAAARSTLGAHFFIRTSSLIIYKIIVVTIILHILSYLCKSVITRLIIINPE